MSSRSLSLIDRFISTIDDGLRTVFSEPPVPQRPHPASDSDMTLSPQQQKLSAALMRINHCGEVCAQALYQGQALTAREQSVVEKMQHAAAEENDHLYWCKGRLEQLDSHTSYLNPLWYTGSLVIGITAGLAGDKWSLGFLAETEKQVVAHLESHLHKLPKDDLASREIVAQMKQDEAQHATTAMESGAAELPPPIKLTMKFMSKVMTKTAYYL